MADIRRLEWIVDELDLDRDHRVLEVGGGHGVAATLVLDRLSTGTYIGIDRSAKMIAASERRNADAVAAGRARFVVGAFPATSVTGPFDRIFGARVVAMLEPDAIDATGPLLAPGGRLVLPFESPDDARTEKLLRRAVQNLSEAGFAILHRAETQIDGHLNICLLTAPHAAPTRQGNAGGA